LKTTLETSGEVFVVSMTEISSIPPGESFLKYDPEIDLGPAEIVQKKNHGNGISTTNTPTDPTYGKF
jgi:hypothetical protein